MIGTLLFVLVIVLLGFVYVGWTHRTNESNDFHTMSRNVPVVGSIATKFTVVGAPHFLIFTTLFYLFGWWPVVFYVGVFFSNCALALLAPAIRRSGGGTAHTFADIAAGKYGRWAGVPLSIVGLLSTLGVLIAQIISGATVVNHISGSGYALAVALISATAIAYLIFGGYKSLVNTDVLQAFIMLLFTVIVAIVAVGMIGADPATAAGQAPKASLPFNDAAQSPFLWMLFIGGLIVPLGSPELWQRTLTDGSDRKARVTFLISAATTLFWGSVVMLIAFSINAAFPGLAPQSAFMSYITMHIPAWLVGIVLMLMLAAMLSTADTVLFAASVISHMEYRRQFLKRGDLKVDTTRVLIVILGAISGIFAIFFSDLIDALGILTNLAYIAAPLSIAAVLERGGRSLPMKKVTYIASLALSFGAFLYVLLIVQDFFSWWAVLIIVFSAIPLAFPGKPRFAQDTAHA